MEREKLSSRRGASTHQGFYKATNDHDDDENWKSFLFLRLFFFSRQIPDPLNNATSIYMILSVSISLTTASRGHHKSSAFQFDNSQAVKASPFVNSFDIRF